MSEPTGNLAPDISDGLAGPVEPEVSLHVLSGLLPQDVAQPACPRCQTDLSPLASPPRFSPRCGVTLCRPSGVPPVPVVPLLPSEEFARTAHARVEDWIRLRERLDAEVTTPIAPALA